MGRYIPQRERDAINRMEFTPPAAPRGKPYTRPADDADRMAVTLARIAFAPRYAHRSHRHQRGEE